MSHAVLLFRSLLIYGICLPLAVALGYLLATPLDFTTFLAVGLVFGLLTVPVILRWHHPLLIFAWNMSVVVPLLPGRPNVWMVLAGVSLLISVIQRALNKQMRFIHVPALIWPLGFLMLVIVITAMFTGGFGFKALGGATAGGKRYFFLMGAILGYFALTCHRIPSNRATLYVLLFFLGSLTAAVGNLAPVVGPQFYFLFTVFPVEKAGLQAVGNEIVSGGMFTRLYGLTVASLGVFSIMLVHYGIRGLLDLRRGWRFALFLAVIAISFVGGFRSILIILSLTFAFQFWFEGLHRTRLLPVFMLLAVFGIALLIPFVNKLPLSMQRTMSVLPVEVDPVARYDAQVSTEWRITMWQTALPEIPKYLLMGKGYSLNSQELEMATEAVARWGGDSREVALLTGDYHNGPLSLIIPFGILGFAGFVWFFAAGAWVLYQNYKYGNPAYKKINTYLLAYYLARVVFFFAVFGSINTEFVIFTGILGLSVSLNGGVRRSSELPQPASAEMQPSLPRLHPFVGRA